VGIYIAGEGYRALLVATGLAPSKVSEHFLRSDRSAWRNEKRENGISRTIGFLFVAVKCLKKKEVPWRGIEKQ